MTTRLQEILKEDRRHLDEGQMEAVSSDENTVVKAGAGSGKTTVLAYRFLRLVLEGKADADRILTLTFTRKAAAEMSERIYMRLLSSGDRAQIARFADATISTLDSFFLEVVRSDSIRYGLVGDFSVEEEDEADATWRRLARKVVQRRIGSEAVGRLVSLYTPDEMDSLFAELARDWFTLDRRYDAEAWQEAFEKKVEEVFRGALDRARDAARNLDGLLSNPENIGRLARALELLERPEEACMPELQTLRVDGRLDRKAAVKAPREAYNEALERFCDAAGAYWGRKGQKAVFELLCEYQDEVLASKRATQTASFLDISRMALDILKTNKRIRRLYKNRFSHIMIDEFQDNNSLQKDILYLLAERLDREGDGVPKAEDLERGKLFFVGDEKQSIYRFRGADVSVFKSLSAEIAGAGGRIVDLKTNYRTEPALIDEFNKLFPAVFRNEGEGYEADFEDLGSRPATEGVESRFVCCVQPDGGGDRELRERTEAAFVASLVERLTTTDICLIPRKKGEDGGKEGGLRRPRCSDIAVLYRTLSRQHRLEKAFRLANIPYNLQQTRALMLGAVANDIYNALQLALFPEDRIARLAFLRSPLCRLSDSDWAKAAQGEELSEEGARRLDGALGRLEGLRGMVGRRPVAQMLESVWYDWGYRFFLVSSRSNQNFVEQFESLWLLAGSFDQAGRTLSDFLTYIRPLMGSNERLRDIEVMREETEGVRMMSIHKSKGLEFPIVVLADAGSGAGGAQEPLLAEMDGLPWPRHMEREGCRNIFWKLQKDKDKAMEAAEAKRLLYVALTRAESHLFMVGSQKRRSGSPALMSMALPPGWEKMEAGPLKDRLAVLRFIGPLPQEAPQARPAGPALEEALPLYEAAPPWRGEAGARRAAATALVRGDAGPQGGGAPLPRCAADPVVEARGMEAGFGTFCHKVLEAALRDGRPPAAREAAALLEEEGLAAWEREALVSSALEFAEGFLESDFYLEEVRPYPRQAEARFFYGMGEGKEKAIAEGVVDLLVRSPRKVLVVDYKTDRIRAPEFHRPQLELYREAVSKTTDLPVECALFYLRSREAVYL